MIYLAPFVLIAPIFLLLAGERVSNRIRDRRQAAREAWIDARSAAERDPARRAAWRMLRNDELEGLR